MSDVEKEANDQMLELALGNVKEAELPEGIELTEWVFTNDPKNPMPRQMFHILTEAAFKNRIGIMHALHEPSGQVHTVICGIEIGPDGPVAWPMAKILVEDEQAAYRAPDGKGGFVGYEPSESEKHD